MAVKFLQVVTQDVDLNRVQNNVAEALRHLQTSIPASSANYYVFTWGFERTENAIRFLIFGGLPMSGLSAGYFAPANDQFAPVPFAGTVTILQLKLLVACAPSTGTITFTVRKNGVDTTMIIVLTASAITGTLAFASTTTGAFTVAVGDLLSIKVLDSGLNANLTNACVTMGIVAS